jgi:hypothetical protein
MTVNIKSTAVAFCLGWTQLAYSEEGMDYKVTRKGVFSCVTQDSRYHSIGKMKDTYGGVTDLEAGRRIRFEYELSEKYTRVEGQIRKFRSYELDGVLSGYSFRCHDVMSINTIHLYGCNVKSFEFSDDRIRVVDRDGMFALSRSYKEDWQGFLLDFYI